VANQLAHGLCPVLNVNQLDSGLLTDNLNITIPPDNVAVIVYTSGTTGQPKGVLRDHRVTLHGIRCHTNSMQMTAEDRCSLLVSVGFSAAFSQVLKALLNGAMIAPYDINRFGIAGLAEWLNRQEITIYHSLPSVFRQMLGVAGLTYASRPYGCCNSAAAPSRCEMWSCIESTSTMNAA
jgi:acyl-coenzyme A synthetase/AMP-(fatty) acid ligase